MTSILERMDVYNCSVLHFPTILQEAMAAVLRGRSTVEAIIHCDIYNSEEWLWSLAFRAEGETRTQRYKLDMDLTGPPEFHDNHLWFPVDWRSNCINDTYAPLLPGKYCDAYNNPGQPKFPGFICAAEDGRDLVGVANCMEELIETSMNEYEAMKATEEAPSSDEPPKTATLPRTSEEDEPCDRRECCGNEYKRKYWSAKKGEDGQWSFSCKCSKPGSDVGTQVDMSEGHEDPWEDDESCSGNSEEPKGELFRCRRHVGKRMKWEDTPQRIPYQKLPQEDQSEEDEILPELVPYDESIEPTPRPVVNPNDFGYNSYAKECYFRFNLLPLFTPPEAPTRVKLLETEDKTEEEEEEEEEEEGPVLPKCDQLVSANQLNGRGSDKDDALNYAMSILNAQEGQPPMELPKRVKLETFEDFESAFKTEIKRSEDLRAGLVKKMKGENGTDIAKLDSYRKTLEMRMDEMKNAEETLKSVHSDYEQMAKVLQSTMEAITMNFFESCAGVTETKAEIEVMLKN